MEQVFVVERAAFFAGAWPQGFVAGPELPGLLAQLRTAGFFVERAAAEQNPAWKQIIPYCVVRQPGAVLCVQRKAAQQEVRLHRLLSIGIGGHINPDPAAPASAEPFFAAALQRELDEEMHGLGAEAPRPSYCGLLNDDSNPVGAVHAGLVYAIDWVDPGAPKPRVREVSKMAGGFRDLAELAPLWQDPARFESWSRILFQAGIAGRPTVGTANGQSPHGQASYGQQNGQQHKHRAPRTPSARPDSAERHSHG